MVSRRCLSHLYKNTPAHFQFPNKAGRRKGGHLKCRMSPLVLPFLPSSTQGSQSLNHLEMVISLKKTEWNNKLLKFQESPACFLSDIHLQAVSHLCLQTGDFQQIPSCAIKWYVHLQVFQSRWEHPSWLSEDLSSMDRWVAGIHHLRSVFAFLLVFM